jgi:hypothetical protein
VTRAEGIQAKNEGENQSNLTGVRMKIWATRFVAWFVVWFVVLVLMDKWSKTNGSDSTGGRMKAPRFVAWSSRI